MAEFESSQVHVGSHGVYQWLVCGNSLDKLLQLCPEVVIGKHVAVTSFDSGSLPLNAEERVAGWEARNGIAYSPKVETTSLLAHDQYDEWYVFDRRTDMGQLVVPSGNVFEAPMQKGIVHAFVNYGGFALHNSEISDLTSLFWDQFDRISPESYVADGDYLTIVTSDKELFAAVHHAMLTLH